MRQCQSVRHFYFISFYFLQLWPVRHSLLLTFNFPCNFRTAWFHTICICEHFFFFSCMYLRSHGCKHQANTLNSKQQHPMRGDRGSWLCIRPSHTMARLYLRCLFLLHYHVLHEEMACRCPQCRNFKVKRKRKLPPACTRPTFMACCRCDW